MDDGITEIVVVRLLRAIGVIGALALFIGFIGWMGRLFPQKWGKRLILIGVILLVLFWIGTAVFPDGVQRVFEPLRQSP